MSEHKRPGFATVEQAQYWLADKMVELDEHCVDNNRFAFEDDADAVAKYEQQRYDGCCGSVDYDIVVAGRLATIGCNYGH